MKVMMNTMIPDSYVYYDMDERKEMILIIVGSVWQP